MDTCTSAAVATFSFSIAGNKLLVTSATRAYAGFSQPPPIKASIRMRGPGRPAARYVGYSSSPSWIRAPLRLSVCRIHPMQRSKVGACGRERQWLYQIPEGQLVRPAEHD